MAPIFTQGPGSTLAKFLKYLSQYSHPLVKVSRRSAVGDNSIALRNTEYCSEFEIVGPQPSGQL
ncbi:hypothetical protein M404DRAFT_847900 [Pisolithus tinctorius Marx 270]|uniref:Uncharacterized protein n=1 Tax=Pisolithus tinctorius Marx 270 TaxID=870435 RepID=A0A0C3JLS5_PISTI|nr:hypothetical protein M404DRAFT_847900 [Pisolithus tinctorius Marx 270]